MGFIHSEAVAAYIALFVHMMLTYNVFGEARFPMAINVFLYAIVHANEEGVHAAYCCICVFFEERLIVAPSLLEQHLPIPELECIILSYLLRDRISPRTPKLMEIVIARAPKNPKAFSVLIADAARPNP